MPADTTAPPTEEQVPLPDGLFYLDGQIMAACRVCANAYEWPADVGDYVEGELNNVCGGSPRCCP